MNIKVVLKATILMTMTDVERNSRSKGRSSEIVICFAGNGVVSSRKDSIRMTDRETISTRRYMRVHTPR